MDTPITDEELLDIAGNVPSADYHKLGVKLGHGLGRLEEILDSKNNDYRRSTVAILMSWRTAAPGECWRTKRSRLRAIFSSLGIKASNALLPGEYKTLEWIMGPVDSCSIKHSHYHQ